MQELHPIIVGRSREVIALLSPRRPCVKRVRGSNNVGRASFLQHLALVITPAFSGYGNQEQGQERLAFANALRESGCLLTASLTSAVKDRLLASL
ncbi:unnamed protein product [Porites lobata]|uniref:Uncharacterized protein n=1 Tax=Porites lobata TaxID=104759 RepID=A0ABN8PQS8_9CNID|nr:unnamed protein product [Porites lobata]